MRRISATEARVHFGDLLRRVAQGEEPVIVEKSGAPQVVVLSVATWERLRAAGDPSGLAALESAVSVGQAIFRAAGPLPDPAEVIRAAREARDVERGLS